MFTRPPVLKPVLAAVLVACGLAACYAQTVDVKGILEDRPRHLRAHFSAEHIPFAVNPYLPPERAGWPRAKRVVVTYEARIDDKPVQMTCTTVYLRRGVVTTDCELGNDGFTIGAYFEITYLGLLPLRSETVAYDHERARPIIEFLEISMFPWALIDAKPNASYRLKGSLGLASHEGNLHDFECAIKTKEMIPAEQLAHGLSGEAIQVEVETQNINGLLDTRDTRFYLPDYGVAIRASVQNAGGTNVYKVKRISVQ